MKHFKLTTDEVTQLRYEWKIDLGKLTGNGFIEMCLHFILAIPAVWEICSTYFKIQEEFWSCESSAPLEPKFHENRNFVHIIPHQRRVPDASTRYLLNVWTNRNILH